MMTDDMNAHEEREPEASQPSSWRRALGVALRLLFVVLIGAGLGAAAYWGVPALYRDFIEPVRQNTQRLDQAQIQMSNLRAEAQDASATQLAQLADIQGEIAKQGETMSALQADVGSLQASQPTLAAGQQSLDRLEADLADLQAAATQTAEQIDTLSAAAATPDATTLSLERRLEILRLMQLVTQARLSMSDGNLGQAGTDLDAALTAVANLKVGADEADLSALDSVETRLNLAQQELKGNPSVARDDLDIAWQLLVELSRAQ